MVQLRTAEKYAVTLDDAMKHKPVESIIFDAYKQVLKQSRGHGKELLQRMGNAAYKRMVLDCMNGENPNPNNDAALSVTQTMDNVIKLTMSARKAFGKARLATATKAADFMRVICGDESTRVAAGGG